MNSPGEKDVEEDTVNDPTGTGPLSYSVIRSIARIHSCQIFDELLIKNLSSRFFEKRELK